MVLRIIIIQRHSCSRLLMVTWSSRPRAGGTNPHSETGKANWPVQGWSLDLTHLIPWKCFGCQVSDRYLLMLCLEGQALRWPALPVLMACAWVNGICPYLHLGSLLKRQNKFKRGSLSLGTAQSTCFRLAVHWMAFSFSLITPNPLHPSE